MAAAKPKTIVDRQWRGDQSWNRELIEDIGVARVRYTFKLDAYVVQSYARASVWSGVDGGWTILSTIPGELLKAGGSYVQDAKPSLFDADLAELRRIVTAVLS